MTSAGELVILARSFRTGERLKPAIGIGRESEREDIDAKLAGGGDLVDILTAGARPRQELLGDRTFGDFSHGSATPLRVPKSPSRRSDRERAPRQLLAA